MRKLVLMFIIMAPLALIAQTGRPIAEAPIKVDKMPAYPGGNRALINLFIDSIDLPKVRRNHLNEDDENPKITLALVIDTAGKVQDVKVIKSINPKTDARCVNLARKLKFTPAMYSGKPVKVTYTLPLQFEFGD